jgi:hypothetical protein
MILENYGTQDYFDSRLEPPTPLKESTTPSKPPEEIPEAISILSGKWQLK